MTRLPIRIPRPLATGLIAATLALTALPALADGHGRHGGHDGLRFCPPGLAKKDPACIPPGHARHGGKHGGDRDHARGHDDDWDDDDHEGEHDGDHHHGHPAPRPDPVSQPGCNGPLKRQADGSWVLDPATCGALDLTPAVNQGKDWLGRLNSDDKAILGLSLLAAMMP